MDVSGESWLNLAVQAPILLIFAYIMIRVFLLIKEIIQEFLSYLKEQRELDRKQTSETVNRMSDEIRTLNSDNFKELSALTQKVDQVIDRMSTLLIMIDKVTTGVKKST